MHRGALKNQRSSIDARANGGRPLWPTLGYPSDVFPEPLRLLAERDPLGSRIVRAYPAATWSEPPAVSDDAGASGRFGRAFASFAERFGLWHILERADRLASVGHYGVLYLNLADAREPHEPLAAGPAPLLGIHPFSETGAQIVDFVRDPRSPRFGLPSEYSLIGGTSDGKSPSATALQVHPSRCLHVAEYLDDNEVYGQPRLKALFNRLMDLEKVLGAGSEQILQSASRIVVFTFGKDAPALTEEQRRQLQGEIDRWEHSLSRTVIGQGLKAQRIAGAWRSPHALANILLEIIAGAAGIPKHILVGSEIGELHSSRSENAWALRIDQRRRGFATHGILRPLILKLIETENLPQPEGRLRIEWPEHDGVDPMQEAEVARDYSRALASYSNSPRAQRLVPRAEFRKAFLGMADVAPPHLTGAKHVR